MDPKSPTAPALATEAVRIAQEAERTVAIAARAVQETKHEMHRAKLLLDGRVTAIAPDASDKIELK